MTQEVKARCRKANQRRALTLDLELSIRGIEWRCVDLKRREIAVENTMSGHRRLILLNSELLNDLAGPKRRNGHSALVFTNVATGSKYTDIKRSFHTACRKAKIEGFRFHDLRHSFVSRLVANGCDLITVKELLGHSSVKITERYTHSRRELKTRAVESLAGQSRGEVEGREKRHSLLHGRDTGTRGQVKFPVNYFVSSN